MKIPIKGTDGNLQGASMIAETHTPYIRKTLPAGSFDIFSYSLMPNHFHLEIRQNSDIPISKLIAKVCTGYGKYFNKKYGKVGGLFQDAFKAVLVTSDEQLLWLSAYIHNNPKAAGIVQNLKDYPYSSYLDYIGQRNGKLCNQSLILGMMNNDRERYKKFVDESYGEIKKRKNVEHLLLD